MPVWSKNSCGLARVVFQEPAEPLTTLRRAFTLTSLAGQRKEQDILLALMITLVMIMLHIRLERMPERAFPTQDQARQALLLHRAYPALRIGVEIRRPRREGHPFHPGHVYDLLKGGAVCPVPVMDEVLPGRQATPLLHRLVARDLHHPCLIGMRRHAGNMDLAAPQMEEKEDVVRSQPTQGPDLGREEVGGHRR